MTLFLSLSPRVLKKSLTLFAVAIFSFSALSTHAQTLKLASVLQDSMVIQQNKTFKVWGTAKPGETVTLLPGWNKESIRVVAGADNRFCAIVEVPAVQPGDFKAYTLTVRSGKESITLKNLLIGEVWICSGQSNMQFGMKEEMHRSEELPKSDLPNVRVFSAGLNFSNTPLDTISGKWTGCNPKTVAPFSAVAYYFGKELYQKLNVPVGIVFTGIGASGAQAYVPREVLAADRVLDSAYLQPYLRSEKSKERIDGGFSFEKVVRPFLLYNALIHPFRNLSVRGFCWYQGEANHMERESYTRLTQTMIKSWRESFGQGELPFYYVQIAPFFHDKEDPSLAFDAYFREAQEKVSELGNTSMVSTMDVGEAKDLHPKNKRPIGQRLAWTALNRTYGKLDVPFRGPQYDYTVFDRSKAIVHFAPNSLYRGLKTNNGKYPRFFALAGEDRKFYPAEATISGNTIVLQSKEVKKPVAARYAFFNYPVTNLENSEGIPVNPFRTDNWPEEKQPVKP
ncbi:MAG: sialate O-acetylesterase [Mucilaginibacter polytrichastri]|nr:sialate O-acetylesterase [Mucilaginibacter polytrichastri]